jgi:putative membrane protein
VAEGTAGVAQATRGLADQLAQFAQQTKGLGDAAQLAALATGVASAAGTLDDQVDGYTTGVATLAADCAASGGSLAFCAQLQGLADGGPGLRQLAQGVAGNASTLADGAVPVLQQTPAIEAGIAGAASGADTVAGLAKTVDDGAGQYAAGVAGFAAQVPALSTAISDSATGARTLADGATELATGVGKLATGASALTSGAKATASGASTLADGTAAAADGASQLAGAMSAAADGARLVAEGVDGIASDGETVAGDVADLATGLRNDASALPTYSDEERAALGAVVADPVDVEAIRLNPVGTTAAGLAPSFIAISLWVGALAIYLVVPALLGPPDRRRWWVAVMAGFGAGVLLGIVQALLTVLLLRFGLGVEVARLPALLLWASLAVVVFVAIVQAFMALFEYRGWLVALLLLVLQVAAAGVIVPAATAPAFLQVVNALMPLGYVIDVARSLIAGAAPSLVPAFWVLAAWLVGSLLVTLAAVHRSTTSLPDGSQAAAV